jgi:hypothetical protein
MQMPPENELPETLRRELNVKSANGTGVEMTP